MSIITIEGGSQWLHTCYMFCTGLPLPCLAPCFSIRSEECFGIENVCAAMLISQAVMGAMVYFLDKLIFSSGAIPIPWEIKHKSVCSDCGRVGRCYRVAGTKCCEAKGKKGPPSFRCEDCEVKKLQHIRD